MSHRDDIPDDQGFEEYLKRGSDLSRRYKTSSQDAVPPELDKKILMQARDAVSDRKVVTHSSWWIRWNKPVALAASLMLAFTVIYRVGYQSIDKLSAPEAAAIVKQETTITSKETELPKVADAVAATSDKPVTANEPPASPQKDRGQYKSGVLAKIESRAQPEVAQQPAAPPVQITVPAPVVSAPAIVPSPAAKESAALAGNTGVASNKAATTREAEAVVDSVTAEDIGKFPDANLSESLQRIPGVELKREEPARKKKLDKPDPGQVLQSIRDLRKQGKQKQADKEWKKFQKDFPDYFVADDDVARGDTK